MFFFFYFIKFVLVIIIIFLIDADWLKFLPIFLPVLLSVAFFTLFERKVLASLQRRRGPNFVGMFGFFQAFADALKLLSKETIIPSLSNFVIFIFAPIVTFFISLVSWSFVPFDYNIVISDIPLGLFFLFSLSSLGVYGIIMSGWSSNSKYAFLGSLRSAAQLISYEVSMGIVIIPILMFSESANLTEIILSQEDIYFFLPLLFSFILFFISILAETNRVPFDLPEAESELVSGYNVEYSSIGFTFFFLSEYSNIILMSSLSIILFFGGWLSFFRYTSGWFFFFFKIFLIMYVFIWIRGTLPRFRYDQLMDIGWKCILPLSLSLVFCSVLLFMFLDFLLI